MLLGKGETSDQCFFPAVLESPNVFQRLKIQSINASNPNNDQNKNVVTAILELKKIVWMLSKKDVADICPNKAGNFRARKPRCH